MTSQLFDLTENYTPGNSNNIGHIGHQSCHYSLQRGGSCKRPIKRTSCISGLKITLRGKFDPCHLLHLCSWLYKTNCIVNKWDVFHIYNCISPSVWVQDFGLWYQKGGGILTMPTWKHYLWGFQKCMIAWNRSWPSWCYRGLRIDERKCRTMSIRVTRSQTFVHKYQFY